jgi:CubicO group peptidase (beta-lactamase class C family)
MLKVRKLFKLSLLVFLALAVLCLPACRARDGMHSKADEIDRLVTAYSERGQFNGGVLVAEAGRVIYKRGFGFADFDNKIPNTADTRFRIGSLTKSFTALLVLQLAERGDLKLDGAISDYLPDYPKQTGSKITIRHLLTHSSGLPDYNSFQDFFIQVQSGRYSNAEIVEKISQYELKFEPGAGVSYSNDGYVLLGAIIEHVTGRSYESVLEENILGPLGMKDSGYSHQDARAQQRALGYRKSLAGYEQTQHYRESPASGIYSTVGDLYLWDQALYGDRLLSDESRRLMLEPNAGGLTYGWKISETTVGPAHRRLKVIEQDGQVFGFNALIVRLVDDKHLIVLVSNVRTGKLRDISDQLVKVLYGQPYELPKQAISDELAAAIREQGIAAALARYHDLSQHHAESYYVDEVEMNDLGYMLINSKRFGEAVEILKLNTALYPQSANAFDSLGEAYLLHGDKDLARISYQKALELNPQNATAVKVIEKLKRQ